MNQWLDKWQGKIVDKTGGKSPVTSATTNQSAPVQVDDDLFN